MSHHTTMPSQPQSAPAAPAEPQRDAKGRFVKGNTLARDHWFEPGQSGNPGGSRSAGAWVQEWINCMATMTPAELNAILSEEDQPVARRIAAQRLLGAAEAGRLGREESEFICHQTLGKPVARVAEEPEDARHNHILSLIKLNLDALPTPDEAMRGNGDW